LIAALVLALAGCGGSDESAGGEEALAVAAAFYPVQEIAEAVGGDLATVTNVVPPGGAAHDIELSTQAAAAVEDADLVLFLGGGFQPELEKAVEGRDEASAVDVLAPISLRPVDEGIPGVVGEVDGTELPGGKDPHVWVDPATYAKMVESIRDAFVAVDPDNAEEYEANADAYLAEVEELDGEFAEALAPCKGKALVTSHAAFGYLADRYGLVQAPIAGITPEDEPDPKSLAATAAFARKNGVTTVFFETLAPPDLAKTVAREIGAGTDILDPVEGIPQDALDEGATYFTIQRDNLDRLVKGLGCTTG
jgi:zinc transport system substrate-binding protein